MRLLVYSFGIALCATILLPEPAFAQVAEDNALDGIIQQYQTTASQWSGTLIGLATNLFILLATLELAYSGIRLALEGAELQAWVGEFLQRLLFLGLFLFLLVNGGFAGTIVQSFRDAAGAVPGGSSTFSPTDILDLGIEISDRVLGEVNFWTNAGESLGLVITALILLISFAIMGAILLLALIEMFILINAGVFLLGFGGNRFTKDFAVKFMTYVVSVGAKLFVLQLVIGLGYTIMTGFLDNFNSGQNAQVLVMIGVAISFLALTRTVPDLVQSIINGIAVGGSGGLWGAAAQTFSAGAVASSAVGRGAGGAFTAGSAVREAAKLASASGQGGAVGTAKALSKAVGGAAADKVRGVPGAQFGSTGGRAIEGLRNSRAAIQGQSISSPAAGTAAAQYISPVGAQAGNS